MRHDTSFIDTEELQAKLNQDKERNFLDSILHFFNLFNIASQIAKHEKQKVRVNVYMLRTNWIFREIK